MRPEPVDVWMIYLLSFVSGAVVAAGLFVQTATIVRQKRSYLGMLLKLLGLAPLLIAVSSGRNEIVSIGTIFFISAAIILVFLTLARNKLLR